MAGARLRCLAFAVTAAFWILVVWPTSSHAQARLLKPFGPCGATIDSAGPHWHCARVAVPLDRSDPQAGIVTLTVARRRAPGPPRPALVGLAGGPGEPALPLAHRLVEGLAPLSSGRDVLLFDQRGTGRSGRLHCRALDAEGGSVGDCARQLGASAGLYGTSQTVADLEDLRALLEIPSLHLYGISYGTVTAQQYLRAHPERVDSLVLDSPFDAEAADPLFTDSFAAVRRVVSSLCPSGGCPGISRDPVGDLRRVAARAGAGELTAALRTGRRGRERRSMTATQLVLWVLSQSYDPSDIGALPALLAAGARGDVVPLLRHRLLVTELRAQARQLDEASAAAYWATWCADAARPTLAGVDERLFDPFGAAASRAAGNADRCAQWPEVRSSKAQALPGSHPTLILSGELDMVTPFETVDRLQRRLGGSGQVLRLPGVGHDILGEQRTCVQAALRDFAAGRRVANTCAPVARRLLGPFARHGAELSSQPGTRRALVALDATLANVEDEIADRWVFVADGWAGLRGGWARLRGPSERTIEFHRYRFVKDVAITGRARLGGRDRIVSGRVRIRWRGADTEVKVTPRRLVSRQGARTFLRSRSTSLHRAGAHASDAEDGLRSARGPDANPRHSARPQPS